MDSAIRYLFQVYYSHANYFLKEPVSYSHLNIVLKLKKKKNNFPFIIFVTFYYPLIFSFLKIKTLSLEQF